MKSIKAKFQGFRKRIHKPSLRALLVVEILLILVVPLQAKDLIPGIALTVTVALFALASLLVTAQSGLAMIVFLTSVILSQIMRLLHYTDLSILAVWFDAGARHTAICAVSWVIAKEVLQARPVNIQKIEAALVLYINLALLFFMIYQFLSIVAPDAFSISVLEADRLRGGYYFLSFSFATMVHMNYGEVVPVGRLAQDIVKIESLIGALYPAAVLIWFLILQKRNGISLR